MGLNGLQLMVQEVAVQVVEVIPMTVPPVIPDPGDCMAAVEAVARVMIVLEQLTALAVAVQGSLLLLMILEVAQR